MTYKYMMKSLVKIACSLAIVFTLVAQANAIGLKVPVNKKNRYNPRNICRLISQTRGRDNDGLPVHVCEYRNGKNGLLINNQDPCPKKVKC